MGAQINRRFARITRILRKAENKTLKKKEEEEASKSPTNIC